MFVSIWMVCNHCKYMLTDNGSPRVLFVRNKYPHFENRFHDLY